MNKIIMITILILSLTYLTYSYFTDDRYIEEKTMKDFCKDIDLEFGNLVHNRVHPETRFSCKDSDGDSLAIYQLENNTVFKFMELRK